MNAMMVDLETMGKGPYAAIVSIGVGIWDAENYPVKTTYKINVSLEDSMKHGFEADASTIQWWMEQSKEARDGLLNPRPTQLIPALMHVSRSFESWNCEQLWSHATFDAVILNNAYKKLDLKVPWKYRMIRDIRTHISDAYGNYDRFLEATKTVQNPLKHDAEWDVVTQIAQWRYCEERIRQIRDLPI